MREEEGEEEIVVTLMLLLLPHQHHLVWVHRGLGHEGEGGGHGGGEGGGGGGGDGGHLDVPAAPILCPTSQAELLEQTEPLGHRPSWTRQEAAPSSYWPENRETGGPLDIYNIGRLKKAAGKMDLLILEIFEG